MRTNKKKMKPYEVDDYLNEEKTSELSLQLNGEPQTFKAKARKIIGKLDKIAFRTENQRKYYKSIKESEISICSGAAGTGKSFISVYTALELLVNTDTPYEKIYITTPIVEAGESLGFLPGNAIEKTDPYFYSTYYIFEKLIGKQKLAKLIEVGVIEIKLLAYLRGVTLDSAICIFEESQNSTVKQMKTFLSRIGEDSKYIISGDIKQNDRFKKNEDTGLHFAINHLKSIDKITQFEFNNADIVRNPLIGRILERFEEQGK